MCASEDSLETLRDPHLTTITIGSSFAVTQVDRMAQLMS